MSYTICFDKQFIKSNRGITPCWLAGDNNVTRPTYKGREAVARDWCVFHNMIGTTEEALISHIQPFLHGYEQHWKQNGKWVDDAALIRWLKNGCKNAAFIEDILAANRLKCVRVYASIWYPETETCKYFDCHKTELDKRVSTTEELDGWIDEFNARKKNKNYEAIFPVIDFGENKLIHPITKTPDPEKRYVMKRGNHYIYDISDTSVSYDTDPRKAKVVTKEEYDVLCASNPFFNPHFEKQPKLVDASIREDPFNAVIRVNDRCWTYYIVSVAKGIIRTTENVKCAKKYRNAKAAEFAMNRIKQRGYSKYNFAVETI